MTSSSRKIKSEILKVIPRNVSERQAIIAGMFCSAAKRHANAPSLSVKIDESNSELVRRLLQSEEINSTYEDGKFTIIDSENVKTDAFVEFYKLCFNAAAIDALASDSNFSRNFIKGVYVHCGYYSNPKQKYSVELHIHNRSITNLVIMMMRLQGIDPLVTEHEDKDVVYLSDGDKVAEFLGIIGASTALMEFEAIRVQHEMNALVNRQTNCDLGNTKRQTEAGLKRRELFKKLEQSQEIAKLTPELMEVVRLHNDNPGLSIAQLGALMDPPISKSGMNHRLQKLMEIAESL
ncbi:MAG: DNA-binding protein WhiA [Clostridia bacterium]|nr:DNA-binding protein WhiA [Clostridia bacterium]